MDNKEKEKDINSFESDKDSYLNDYKYLFQKLKTIKENIYLLEKNFLDSNK